MFKKEKMPKPPTDEVVSEEALSIPKEEVESLEAQKFQLEKDLKELEEAIADREEQIRELREENIRRENLGSSALLNDDMRALEKEIKAFDKERQHIVKDLVKIKDALLQFGSDEKEPEEYN